jgi:hypothetical protein
MRSSRLIVLTAMAFIVIFFFGGIFSVMADSNNNSVILKESKNNSYKKPIQSQNLTHSNINGSNVLENSTLKSQAGKITEINDPITLMPIYPGENGYSCNCSHDGNLRPLNRCTSIPTYIISSPGSYEVGTDNGNRNCSIILHAPNISLDGNGQTSSSIIIASGASDAMVKNFTEITGDGLYTYGDNSAVTNNTIINVNNQGISVYGSNCILIGNTVSTIHTVNQESNKTA